MKYESPSSSESWTRMLVCTSSWRHHERGGADGCAGLREHGVQPDRAQQRALPRHVRAGDQQQRSARTDGHVVRDPPVGGNQRMPERRWRGVRRRRPRRPAAPTTVRRIAARASTASASISPSASIQPRTCAPDCCPPALEREVDVEVPQRQRLDRESAAARRRSATRTIRRSWRAPARGAARHRRHRAVPSTGAAPATSTFRRTPAPASTHSARARADRRSTLIEDRVDPRRERERQDDGDRQGNQQPGGVGQAQNRPRGDRRS